MVAQRGAQRGAQVLQEAPHIAFAEPIPATSTVQRAIADKVVFILLLHNG
jgi:hypothetical protein